MRIVNVRCPKSIDLKNIMNSQDSLFQTVDIYDSISIISYCKKESGIFIKSSNNLDNAIKDDIKLTINLFLEYTNININNLEITIEKNEIDILNNYDNILAGLLIGLNIYFKTNLLNKELVHISKLINNLVAYYIECGYKRLDQENLFYSISEYNKYNKYYIFDDIKKDELYKLRDLLEKYKKNDLKGDYCNNYYFFAIKNNIPFSIPLELKKSLINSKIITCKNTKESKVLIKYINNF